MEVLSKLAQVLFREKAGEKGNDHIIDESLALARRAIALKPKDCEVQLLIAKALDRKGMFHESVEAFNQAIKLQSEQANGQPPKANVFFQLGGVYERAKEFKKAVLNYKKCLTLDTKHFGACIHLANLLANVGEGQRAAKYFKHAIKVATENPSGIGKESLINAYFGLGKTLQ